MAGKKGGKGGKAGKAGKAEKAGKAGKGKKEVVKKKTQEDVIEDIPLIVKNGTACFKFRNKDHYKGDFQATNVPLTAYRHGPGEYTTHDGHTYSGDWEEDVLHGDVDISYADGTRYAGNIIAMTYEGPGSYIFADSAMVRSRFVEDKPFGEMMLIDPTGHTWKGMAEEYGVTFHAVNRFLPLARRYPPPSLSRGLLSTTAGVLEGKPRRASLVSMAGWANTAEESQMKLSQINSHQSIV